MGRFETELLAIDGNLASLADLSGMWIDRVHNRKPPRHVVLDMDSSVSPTYGEQEGTAYNGHFHGIDGNGEVVVRRQLRRRQVLAFFSRPSPCLVGMEACATSHHWARELQRLGHDVRLMPPSYVKPYVKRNKNDSADAEAICEAVQRPNMRFVPIKTVEQQSVLMVHRTRLLFVRQRTMLINAIRAHMAEFGIVAGVGRNGVESLLERITEGKDERIPPTARDCLVALAAQLELVKRQILEADPAHEPDGVLGSVGEDEGEQRQLLAREARKIDRGTEGIHPKNESVSVTPWESPT